MPLDPSIFFQAAALRQANQARQQAMMQSAFDRLAKQQMMQQQIELEKQQRDEDFARQKELIGLRNSLDPENQIRKSIADELLQQGIPESEWPVAVMSLMQGPKTSYIQDKLTGSLVPRTEPTAYERLYGRPLQFGAMTQAPQSPMDALAQLPQTDYSPQYPSMKKEVYGPEQNELLANYGRGPTIPGEGRYAGSPNQMKAIGEANVELQKQAAGADIAASQKGAETYQSKRAESQSGAEDQLTATENLIAEMQNLRWLVAKQPSGLLGNVAAEATNILDVPSERMKAKADLGPALQKMIADAKDIIRKPGEGTFSEGDRKQIEEMFYDANDSAEIKARKYESLLGAMERAAARGRGRKIEYKEGQLGKPGWSDAKEKRLQELKQKLGK